jgi:hypothetical protein
MVVFLFFFFFFFCSIRGLNSGPIPWVILPAFCCDGVFWDRVCLWTSILLISASWVARITGVSHWRLASHFSWIWAHSVFT